MRRTAFLLAVLGTLQAPFVGPGAATAQDRALRSVTDRVRFGVALGYLG